MSLDPMAAVREAFSAKGFRERGHRLVDALADYLGSATQGRSGAVLPWVSPVAQMERWPGAFPSGPAGDGVFDELLRAVIAGSNHLHDPRFVGHQVTSPLPSMALCDLVASLLNNGMAVYEMGPIGTVMEQRVLRWLADRFEMPGTAGGVLTSGGSVGNLTALLAARQARAGFDVWDGGAAAGPPLALLASAQTHYCVNRAARILGLGREGTIPVPVDSRYRLDPAALPVALEAARRAGRRPFAVVASAGSTSTGAHDPLDAVADFCQKHGLWMHIDAAHGGAAALSPRYRDLVAGISRADSIVVDAHKMMLTPALATAVLFRDARDSRRAFAQEAEYIFTPTRAEGEAPWQDIGERTLECTKPMIALKLYVALQVHGTELFADYVTGMYDLARRFATRLRREPDLELATEPDGNIVCFRLRPPGQAPGPALDDLQSRIRSALVESGRFYLVKTTLPAGVFLRVTLINPFTDDGHLDELIAAIRAISAA